MSVLTQCLGALYPPGTNPLSGLVLGWLRQVVIAPEEVSSTITDYSLSILNKELSLEKNLLNSLLSEDQIKKKKKIFLSYFFLNVSIFMFYISTVA